MRDLHHLSILFGLILVVSAVIPPASHAGADVETLTRDNTAFALHLYDQLRQEEGNLFFSPHSISTALAMTYAGAREETRDQMKAVLRFSMGGMAVHNAFSALEERLNGLRKQDGIELLTANSLWPQAGEILEEYLSIIDACYDAGIKPVDYRNDASREQARKRINGWVAERTREKIQDLVPEGVLDALTRLVLVNAIYFKGDWALPFEEAATADGPFHLDPGNTITHPLMHQEARFGYGEQDDLQILEMDYEGGDLSMLVILPRRVDGLGAVEARLDPETLSEWGRRLRRQKVDVYLPTFKMSAAFRLDQPLKQMGMTHAFDPAAANFAGIDGHPDRLYITAALHQAFVEVNEAGTEAAAATAVAVGVRSLGPPKEIPLFRADHPFLFLIREKQTGALLFLGRVADPSAAGN
jgi:serpin B